jgi:3-oxoacyl-[acyl-carrier-protein] synthase II
VKREMVDGQNRRHARAVVTGVGPISAIGASRDRFWKSLVRGQHGFGPITLCDASRSPSKVGAEVKDFRLERYVQNGRVMARFLPRPVQFALAASVVALHDAGFDLDRRDGDLERERLGIQVGTSIGNLEYGLRLNDEWQKSGVSPAHAAFYAFNHSTACVLSSFFDIEGPIHTTTSGCNSGLDALGQAARLVELGVVDAMLVVGTDCELVPEVLAALNASGSLSQRYNDDPARASRPFDRGRDGNVLGEGAAAMVIESEAHALARGARIYARLAGYRVGSTGKGRRYSHDAPTPDVGASVRALRGVIGDAGWQTDDVDLVSANGSSSVIYDRLEALAFAEVFGARLPEVRVHSTKSMLGQHGAGSSALQAVAACLAIDSQTAPPTINCEAIDPACGPLRIVRQAEHLAVRRILVHAIGLGGFYYSAAAFEAPGAGILVEPRTSVRWSREADARFAPVTDFLAA